MIVPTFWRNTIYFTFSLRYPDESAATMPRRNQSLRSDRKDLAPLGGRARRVPEETMAAERVTHTMTTSAGGIPPKPVFQPTA